MSITHLAKRSPRNYERALLQNDYLDHARAHLHSNGERSTFITSILYNWAELLDSNSSFNNVRNLCKQK